MEAYLQALRSSGFSGDIETSYAAREVLAVDNSIYHLAPGAVAVPRRREDIVLAVSALRASGPGGPSLTVRGGGTGTNGQSLNSGVVLDTSRHLTRIVDLDPVAGTVKVEPGVVLDQLNAFLAPHGWFFPPMVSTSSRATIGGMVATDASGKGSRHYGRTSDYILGLDLVLADGEEITIAPETGAGLAQWSGRGGRIARAVRDELEAVREHIEAVFPAMNRGLTGYNLKQARMAGGGIDLCRIIAGSEGTLAVTSAISLRLRRKPTHSSLVVLFYDDFANALAHVPALVATDPLAVEILDDKIIGLARSDPVWTELGALFGEIAGAVGAVNVVEVAGHSDAEVEERMSRIHCGLAADATAFLVRSVTEPKSVRAVWELRSRAVGLLGALDGDRKGVPFVEDTAVPPERLAAYAADFRALLDGHGLSYGMFGHADVGCLHVRPTLDMTAPDDRALIRVVSDAVHALTRRHGGLIWGEHGRGFRGDYSADVFGPVLYPVIARIKAMFDPDNRLNPGKLAAPPGMEHRLVRLDEAPFRGALDEQIPAGIRDAFGRAVDCNGNGACHHWDAREAMCPSYKATRDKTQSPNGRAALFRAWARNPDALRTEALKESLDTCLSCRACASSCPVKVDIPTMKSRFLERYHARRCRPARDWAVRVMEPVLLALRRLPRLGNGLLHNAVARHVLRLLGLVDLPRLAGRPLEALLLEAGLERFNDRAPPSHPRSVIVVPDTFSSSFDPGPVVAAGKVLRALGFHPVVVPPVANGKGLEVRGFGTAYRSTASSLQRQLADLAALGFPVVGIEPSTTIQARSDGASFLLPIDAFLAASLPAEGMVAAAGARSRLFLHCTEGSSDPAAAGRWRKLFRHFGSEVEVVAAGCCGMSGLFGHESEHQDLSRRIFELSWSEALREDDLATGFSCRSQAARFAGRPLRHPIERMAEILGKVEPAGTVQP